MTAIAETRRGLGVTLDIPPLATALTYSSQTALGIQIARLQLFYGFLNGWSAPPGLSTGDAIAFQNQRQAFLTTLLDILTQLVNADHAQLVFLQQELSTVESLMASNASLTAQVQGHPIVATTPAPSSDGASLPAATTATPSSSTTAPASSPWPWGLGGTVIGGILGFAVGRKTAKKR